MSDYTRRVIRPDSGETVFVRFLDNHFGKNKYGIRIEGEDRVREITSYTSKGFTTKEFNNELWKVIL